MSLGRTATTTVIARITQNKVTEVQENKQITVNSENIDTTLAVEQYYVSAIASGVACDSHNTMTQPNVQAAIQQLDSQFGRGPIDPTAENQPFLDNGDLFYNTNTNQLKVYRSGSWQLVLQAEGDMDTLDGSTF
jgi:hypothetical protein|tara:strand:- start:5365 stop:5766 length:402 start_codon:yes stop_codon:yes gene_type:complete